MHLLLGLKKITQLNDFWLFPIFRLFYSQEMSDKLAYYHATSDDNFTLYCSLAELCQLNFQKPERKRSRNSKHGCRLQPMLMGTPAKSQKTT